MTMSNFEIYKQNEIRKLEIEVKALVALVKYGVQVQKFEALKHLEHFAYPERLAEKINKEQTKLEYQ